MTIISIIGGEANRHQQLLKLRFPHAQWHCAPCAEQLSSEGLSAEILLAPPIEAAQLVTKMPQLRWCQSTFAGVEPLLASHLPQHYQLSNIRGVFGPLMSEYVFAYLLAECRQINAYQQQQQQQQWIPRSSASLQGLHFCTLGTGSIAQHLASTASQFGMHCSGISRNAQAVEPYSQVANFNNGRELLAQADVVVAVLPHTQATENLLNQAFFQTLKPSVRFFNVGRGKTLDEDALLEFLRAQPTAKAVIDVYQHEPLAGSSLLWQQPNLQITPHIAAPSRFEDVAAIFRTNLERYLAQKELLYRIDFAKGY